MDMYSITGGRPLRGTVHVSGSKNACLPLMCAAMLADGPVVLENVPDLRDIRSMMLLIEHLNGKVVFKNSRMVIDPTSFDTDWVPYDMMSKMRASMYAFGPMIARRRKAAVSKPGGCNIGSRPIDLHLRGFRALGVQMVERQGYVHARHDGLKGADLSLLGPQGPSVGATCNVLMAAVLAEGQTTIRHAAREPEVQELALFLNAMGAKIDGIGSSTLAIEGVEGLNGTTWRVQPDRIEAATYCVAAAMTDGDVLVKDADPPAMTATLWALREWGALVEHPTENSIRVRRADDCPKRPLELETAPYPGLATDVQPLFAAMLAMTPGVSTIRETIYFDRFMHAQELNRMGARTMQDGNAIRINGVETLEGAAVMSSDLRAGAALTIAAIAAKGDSQVRRIYHVERGYERFEQKLAALGAQIVRTKEDKRDPGLDFDWATAEATEDSENETAEKAPTASVVGSESETKA